MDVLSKLSQLVGALGGAVESSDPVMASFVQWASRIQEQLFTRWHNVAATGIPCAKITGRARCSSPAVSTCRFCRQPTCLAHAAVAQNGELWCLPCMARAEGILRAHAQARAAEPRAAVDETAVRRQKLEVLGLGEDATHEDVHAAFRKLSLKFHPDRHVSATAEKKKRVESRYRAITEAYHWLQSRERKVA